MDFGEVRWSENPLPGGSAAASIHLGRYKDEDIVVKWFNFNGQRTMNQFRKVCFMSTYDGTLRIIKNSGILQRGYLVEYAAT